MYIGIVGGGITGLYCALKLSKKYKIFLFDERDYYGGRIKTYYSEEDQFEYGAARFNDNHSIFLSLIKEFNLTKISLPKKQNYIHISNGENELFENSQDIFEEILKKIINQTKLDIILKEITFYEHCCRILSKKETNLLINLFGYYTEFMIMNAYDALQTFKTDFTVNNYYILKEGLTHLCNKMSEKIKKNGGTIFLNTKVIDIQQQLIKTKTTSFGVDKIIICTKSQQINDFKVLNHLYPIISMIHEAPLIRIFAKYSNKLFNDIPKITTNNSLRQIIPINDTVIMISYVDGIDTKLFLDKDNLKSEKEIRKIIKKNLKLLFPNKNITEPDYIKSYYWKVGTHSWKKGSCSLDNYQKLCNPIQNVYICGEAFSKKQAWMEGGLEMANDVINIIN